MVQQAETVALEVEADLVFLGLAALGARARQDKEIMAAQVWGVMFHPTAAEVAEVRVLLVWRRHKLIHCLLVELEWFPLYLAQEFFMLAAVVAVMKTQLHHKEVLVVVALAGQQ